MNKQKQYLLILMINLLLTGFIFGFLDGNKTLTNLINALFFITVFYFIVYLYLFITKGKFFDGVIFATRRFKNFIVRKAGDMDEGDQSLPSETVNLQVYHTIRWQFYTLLILLLVLQTIYFI